MSPDTNRSSWPLAAFAASLLGEFAAVLEQIAALGFTHVDVVAEIDRPADQLEALADSGLLVSCAAVGRQLPPGHALDAADVSIRRVTLSLLQRQIADAARLGATTTYLVPPLTPNPSPQRGEGGNSSPLAPLGRGGTLSPLFPLGRGVGGEGGNPPALTCFAEGCALLADYAAGCMVRLCVEHVPGRALPTAAATIDWLERLGHPHLGLLLDVGHCLISGEDAAAVVRRAGERLGYVHLDDNDGIGDLHWPLFAGRLTEPQLADAMRALQAIGYRGALALELNPANADPLAALRDGKRMLERIIGIACPPRSANDGTNVTA